MNAIILRFIDVKTIEKYSLMILNNKKVIKNNTFYKEVIRFGIVGTISTGITYGVYYLLLRWINPSIAFTIAYLLAFIVNFILTTSFTFSVSITTKRGVSFAISNVINYSLSVGLLNFFIWIGLPESIAPIPMFAVTIPLNFVIVRFLIKK